VQRRIDIDKTSVSEPMLGADEPLGGEQGHLGVVGDPSETTEGWSELADAMRPEAPLDLGPGEELDWGTKGISDCATQEASDHAFSSDWLGHEWKIAIDAPGWRSRSVDQCFSVGRLVS
jgi:hypothetical protein